VEPSTPLNLSIDRLQNQCYLSAKGEVMKMKIFPVFVVLLLLTLSMAANAHQVVLNPTQDTIIWSYAPDNNYGGLDYLAIGCQNSGWLDILIQFDLSSYSGVIVESAYLRLYVFSQSGTFPPTDIFIARLSGSWDEMAATWNNCPATDNWFYIGGPGSVDSWWVIDVSGYVDGWVSGTHDNYGFLLGTDDSNEDYFDVYSREYSDTGYRPQLELNYHNVSVQPTSLGTLKAIYK
jgi:hypothetical protein